MRFLKKELKQLSYPSKEKVVKVTTITLFSSIILAGLISLDTALVQKICDLFYKTIYSNKKEPILALFFADFLFFIMIQRGRNSTFQFEAYYFH